MTEKIFTLDELKNYDGAMRYMIDNYINADASELQYKLDEATLLDVIVASGIEKATQTLPKNVRKNAPALSGLLAGIYFGGTQIHPHSFRPGGIFRRYSWRRHRLRTYVRHKAPSFHQQRA